MNSLIITQTKANGIVEGPVSNQIITKLYNIGKDDDEHQTLTVGVDTTDENRPVSTVSGRIRVNSAFANQLEYLAVKFPDLEINADSTYIYFEDPEVERVLLTAGIGDGVGITASDAADANLGTIFKNNTTITSFNTFEYFNRANTSPTNEMFRGCTNLENIDLSNVTRFSYRQFMGTNITDVNAPNLVSSDTTVFANCNSLQSVTSLGNLASIPDSMFQECSNLQTVNLPDNCATISGSAFIIWNGSTGSLQQVNGIEHVSSFGYRCFLKQKMLRLTANDLANAVSIGEKAFQNVLVSSINSPKLMTLGEISFADNSALTTIECLGKVSNIPSSCFGNDPSLQTVKIPYECTNIGNNAFQLGSSLTSIKQYTDSIDNWVEGVEPTTGPLSRVTSFGNNCFKNCSLLSLTDSDVSGAISIGSSAFENCTSAHFVNLDLRNVPTLASSAFSGTNVDNVVWSNSKTDLPTAIFQSCGLKSITNLDAVTKVWGRSLKGCQLNHVLYFKNVDKTHYGQSTFGGDSGCVFCGDNRSATVPALYMPKTIDIYGGYYSGDTYSNGFFGSRGTATIPVVYFKELTDIYPGSFASLVCTSFIINNTTPPVWYNSEKKTDEEVATNEGLQKNKAFPDSGNCRITNIYVPDSALSTYLADPNWASLTDSSRRYPVTFLGMSNLTHYATEADWVTAGKPADGIIDAYMN